ncbi:hypothetical protein [Roseobacter fucihabitans]|uniref:hypothetical protein n=1 Tax=Roseobacter fucihabitans TaxID=1537242 RepID=UPI001652C13D|nr:hypothetical protein [Roseobacter litoralis]
MSEIWLSRRSSEAIDTILDDDLDDIVSLVASIGYDPRTFFEFGNCRGLDFSGSSINGISFLGADISECTFFEDQLDLALATKPVRY